ISIMAGGGASRPDTLKQTDQPPIAPQPPCERGGPYVFKPLDDPLVLSGMPRPGADVREAKLLQELSDIARMKVDAEPLGNDTLEIDAPPPHDAIFLTVRASLYDLRKLSQL